MHSADCALATCFALLDYVLSNLCFLSRIPFAQDWRNQLHTKFLGFLEFVGVTTVIAESKTYQVLEQSSYFFEFLEGAMLATLAGSHGCESRARHHLCNGKLECELRRL